MWLLDQMGPEHPVSNVASRYRLGGPLDGTALGAALSRIVRRHEALRTRIEWSGSKAVHIISPARPVAVPVTDLSAPGAAAAATEARRLAQQHAYVPFQLAGDVLLRAHLYVLGHDERALLINLHHIATDALSQTVLWLELRTLYAAYRRGAPSPLPAPAIQYAEFARWQRDQLQLQDEMERWLRFGRRQIAVTPALQRTADRPRPAQISYRGAGFEMMLDADLVAGRRECARRERATLFMVALAVEVLLHRLSAQGRFAVGTAVAGRTRAETTFTDRRRRRSSPCVLILRTSMRAWRNASRRSAARCRMRGSTCSIAREPVPVGVARHGGNPMLPRIAK